MTQALSPSSLHCPRCMTPMLLGHAGGMRLHGCGTCGGVWLGSDCAQRLASALPTEAIEMAARYDEDATVSVDTASKLDCPVCGVVMHCAHASAAKIDLDTCMGHGTWYDRQELGKIAGAIRNAQWNDKLAAKEAKDKAANGEHRKRHEYQNRVIDAAFVGADIALDALSESGAAESVVEVFFDFLGGLFD